MLLCIGNFTHTDLQSSSKSGRMEAWSIPTGQKTARVYPRTDLKLWSPFMCQGAKMEGKHWVRSCSHGAILRKTPGQKPLVPCEQTVLLTRMCTGGAAEPETPEACHFEAPLASPQGSQPIFRHTSDLWHISFAQVIGAGVTTLRWQLQFHLHMLHLYTYPLYSSHTCFIWIIVTGAEVLTILLSVRIMQYFYLHRELKRCLWWSRKLFGIAQGHHNLPGMLKNPLLPQDEPAPYILE